MDETEKIEISKFMVEFNCQISDSDYQGYRKQIQYLKQWLTTLTLNNHTAPPTTTTTSRPTTTEDPVALPFEEAAAGNNPVGLDRFECVCDGDLIELLKSKTFINIQIAHD
ncbi:unnamed protein product [Caenorhabditis nigoni]